MLREHGLTDDPVVLLLAGFHARSRTVIDEDMTARFADFLDRHAERA